MDEIYVVVMPGRYQAAVTAMHGRLYAVGGCDAWNCLNTVEVYNPESNTWDFLPPLNTARRGCGVAFYQSKSLPMAKDHHNTNTN